MQGSGQDRPQHVDAAHKEPPPLPGQQALAEWQAHGERIQWPTELSSDQTDSTRSSDSGGASAGSDGPGIAWESGSSEEPGADAGTLADGSRAAFSEGPHAEVDNQRCDHLEASRLDLAWSCGTRTSTREATLSSAAHAKKIISL